MIIAATQLRTVTSVREVRHTLMMNDGVWLARETGDGGGDRGRDRGEVGFIVAGGDHHAFQEYDLNCLIREAYVGNDKTRQDKIINE
jgi:hypothetical protein